ncbi:hypothetical protein Curi_c18690 [Gottschalkia acidurici 9a]|uniref:Lipoprotein n=1 Tax=Gottschalkia acidurici (strain ATCC 7906 / DSM 604 / BCRC 14475 / CIP 104303 / KCTC 5404 / NCIMB 10678 / 9a) TaxID=1128398 RepID=K0B1Q7_GOTA9|nr:hypothetical protein [Gottschalkia acidurici]AFS78875.1 hypothetical protein Curi_c18690 [Gottschalkia acidurici 9a]
MKRLSIISLVLVLAIAFTGCTSEELKLYNAFEKSQDITSMESSTDISFTIEAEGLSQEDQQAFEMVKNSINNSKFNVNQKVTQNKDQTIAKGQIDLGFDIGGVKSDMQIWVDSDVSGDKPKLVEVIKMPSMLMSSFGPENADKQYIVYDVEKLLSQGETPVDFSKMMNLSKDMGPKLNEFLKNYVKNFDPGFKLVESKGNSTVNGKDLSMYQVKLDDASFKKLVRSSVNYSLDNKETIEFVKEYINLVSSAMEVTDPENVLAQEEIDKELKTLQENLPKFKAEFNKFMDNFDKVKVIGDKGIVIDYGINKDGYIVYEAGSIDLSINIAEIEKAFASDENNEAPTAGIVKLGVNYKTNIKSINEKLNIEIPQTNEQNSISIEKLMELDTIEE